MALRPVFVRCISLAALAAVVMGVGSRRSEAQLGLIPHVRLKAGLFLPTDTSLKNAVGSTWLKIGADVTVPLGPSLPVVGGSMRVGIDYQVNGKSNIVPITLSYVLQPSVGLKSPLYVGAGVGAWTGHIHGYGTATRLGARLLGGFQFSPHMFGEVQYDLVGSIGGARANGLSVLIGTGF